LKKLRKFFFLLIISFVVLFGAVSAYLYFNQDKVVQQLIGAINKQLNVPVEVSNISINWYTDFPHIAVVCTDVNIQEAIEGSTYPLAKLEQLALSFNLLSLIKGDYVFEKVSLTNGEVTIRISESGERNFLIVKRQDKPIDNKEVNFNLSRIHIDKVKINYVDESIDQSYITFAESLNAALNKVENDYFIDVKGKLNSKSIKIGELNYFEDKALSLNAHLVYNESREVIDFKPSEIVVNQNNFSVTGQYKIQSNYINLKIDGTNTDFQTISTLLPKEYANYFADYQPKGDANFSSKIIGVLDSKNNPLVEMDFSVSNGSLYEATYKTSLDSINLQGNFTNGSRHSLATSKLSLRNINARLKEEKIQAELTVDNLERNFIKLSAEGKISTYDLFSFLPQRDQFSGLAGNIKFNFSLAGAADDFKKASTASRINNTGEIVLTEVGGIYKEYPLPMTAINGRLLFNKNDIAINRLSGRIGESDINMTGFFLNIFPYLLEDDQSLLIESETNSSYIDLNELLSGLSNEKNTTEKQQESYKFSISPYLKLELKSKIDKLIFQNFEGRRIAGSLNVNNQVLRAENLNVNSMGGKIKLSGSINTQPDNLVDIHTTANFNQLNIDSIFYTFNDFKQDFLTQKHLKGKIDADVMAHIVLDKSLNFKPEDFTASIAASIKNGELNDFEPMQSLSEYVNEDQLANLSFGELSNSIQIKDQTIYLPEMLIKSNISEILIQGTHTFDQRINYRLLVPLKNYKKPDKDEAFGAIEETTDYTKLHLKIIGTTDDFDVSWDAKQSLKSVAEKVKEEGKNLVNIITGKEVKKEKKKEIEVTEDDYFDW
jgi:hypothetical protein